MKCIVKPVALVVSVFAYLAVTLAQNAAQSTRKENTQEFRPALKQRPLPPDEQLLPWTGTIPVLGARERKRYPQKYSSVFMPVSLAEGRVRTPEFPGTDEWYDIMVQIEKPLPFQRMVCMMGVTADPLDEKGCTSGDPLLRAEWTVWQDGHIVEWGDMPKHCACIFTDKNIYKQLGSFPLKANKKYVVQVHFTKDGSQLDVANPRLIVIRHGDMW